jgi:hypothetical protein
MPPIQLSSGINFPFENVEIAQALSVLPNKYGKISRSGLFGPGKGLISRYAEIRIRDGKLVVLGSKNPGADSDTLERGDEDALHFPIAHFPWKGSIGPGDIQGLFAFEAGPHRIKQQAEALNELLIDLREPADATTEYTRVGALKGLIKDGNGKTLYDLYDAFEITKKVIYFDLSNENADVPKQCRAITQHIEKNLGGDQMTQVRCYVTSDDLNDILNHPSVEKYIVSGSGMAVQALRLSKLMAAEGQFVSEIEINGVVFETYDGEAVLRNGSTDPYLTAGTGQAFPVGTRNAFRTFYAPAHAMSAANKLGQRIWSSMKVLDHDQGIEVAMQMNELNICSLPQALVEVSMGADPS